MLHHGKDEASFCNMGVYLVEKSKEWVNHNVNTTTSLLCMFDCLGIVYQRSNKTSLRYFSSFFCSMHKISFFSYSSIFNAANLLLQTFTLSCSLVVTLRCSLLPDPDMALSMIFKVLEWPPNLAIPAAVLLPLPFESMAVFAVRLAPLSIKSFTISFAPRCEATWRGVYPLTSLISMSSSSLQSNIAAIFRYGSMEVESPLLPSDLERKHAICRAELPRWFCLLIWAPFSSSNLTISGLPDRVAACNAVLPNAFSEDVHLGEDSTRTLTTCSLPALAASWIGSFLSEIDLHEVL